jgi:hypothetical protein
MSRVGRTSRPSDVASTICDGACKLDPSSLHHRCNLIGIDSARNDGRDVRPTRSAGLKRAVADCPYVRFAPPMNMNSAISENVTAKTLI